MGAFLRVQRFLALLTFFVLATIQTAAMKNILAQAYADAADFAAVYTTAPGGSAGTEPAGGSPAYARKALTWGSPSAGVIAASPVTFDIPSGSTLVGGGVHTLVTAGVYLDGGALTSQAFSSQGTYALTCTYTQT